MRKPKLESPTIFATGAAEVKEAGSPQPVRNPFDLTCVSENNIRKGTRVDLSREHTEYQVDKRRQNLSGEEFTSCLSSAAEELQ